MSRFDLQVQGILSADLYVKDASAEVSHLASTKDIVSMSTMGAHLSGNGAGMISDGSASAFTAVAVKHRRGDMYDYECAKQFVLG
jgi:hypothetical protein